MGLLNRIFNVKANSEDFKPVELLNATTTKTVDMTQDTTIELWDDEGSSSGVTEDDAMGIAPLNAGIDLISSSIACLPVNLFQIDMKTGEKIIIREDYRNNLLNVSNNIFEDAFNLKYSIAKDLILNGTSYVYAIKNRNTIESLYHLNKGDVNSQLKKIGKNYDYTFSFNLFQDYITADSTQVLVFAKCKQRSTDLEGRGILQTSVNTLNLAMKETEYAQNALNNKFPSYLSTDDSLSPQAKSNIRSSFKGLATSKEIPIFEEGLKYNQVSTPNKDLELLESRQYTTQLISNLLNLPLSFLTSASSYNTSEEESLRFQRTILPYIRIMEETFNRYLLTVKELEMGYRFQFDMSALMKANMAQHMEYLSKGTNAGLFTINEGRAMLDLKAREGGDVSQLPVNSYFLDENGEIILPSQQHVDNKIVEEENEDIENEEDIE